MGRQTRWKLTVRDESKPSFTVMLACGDKVVVGRSRSCDIVLSDLSVSRKHCFFGVGRDGVLKLVDFGALHPTLLNGVVVKESSTVPLQDGCKVSVGRGSFIKVECLGEKPSSRVDYGDPLADDELEHTHAGGAEESVLAEVAEVDLEDDPFNNGETHCSENENSNDPGAGAHRPDLLQPVSLAEDDQRNLNNDKLDEKSQVDAPRHSSAKSVSLSGQQDETTLIDSEELTKQLQPEKLIPPKICEGSPVPKDGTLVGDDDGGLNADEATKLSDVNALKPSSVKKINRSAPQKEANHNHAEVLGKTLQGKLIQPKKRKPNPVLNNTVRNGSDDEVLKNDGAMVTSQLDETSYVDPAELQRIMRGKAGSAGEKRRRKGADPRGAPRKGDEAGNTVPSDSHSQDETSYVDPEELQRILQGKVGSSGKKRRKKDADSRGSSKKGDNAGNTVPSDGGSQDETSYVDPAELQKILQGTAGLFGKKGGKKGAALKEPFRKKTETEKTALDDGDSQDETSYIDPAELQKLIKGKAKPPWSNKGGLR